MAILYYNNADNDGDWDNLNNWWDDSGYSTQATALPTDGDGVVIDGEVTNGPTVGVTLLYVICGDLTLTPFNVSFSAELAADAYEFYNNVTHTGLYLSGLYDFYDNSINAGTVNSNGEDSGFWNMSANTGTVSDSTTFNNNSQNQGTCDQATFNDSSSNADGTILGDAFFQTFTLIGGGAYVDTLGYGTGTVNGGVYGNTSFDYIYTIEYNINSLTGYIALTQPIEVRFNNSTSNRGYIFSVNNTMFNNSSYNIGTIGSNAQFNYGGATLGVVDDITGYASGTVNGAIYDSTGTALISAWRFTTTDLLSGGVCDGNAIFKNTSVNRGTVTGNAYFDIGCVKKSLSAGNIGTIGGTVFLPFADILGTGLQ